MRCCAEIDLQITKRNILMWVALDPCNFRLLFGFEKWLLNVIIFEIPFGEVQQENISDIFTLK